MYSTLYSTIRLSLNVVSMVTFGLALAGALPTPIRAGNLLPVPVVWTGLHINDTLDFALVDRSTNLTVTTLATGVPRPTLPVTVALPYRNINLNASYAIVITVKSALTSLTTVFPQSRPITLLGK